ncbi:MAG: response regulator transcription factor [Bacteroidia bacterium]|nr:response regulator transcription factor [Bacteroidia bacterium]
MVKVLIADNNFLSRTGLELLLGEIRGIELIPTVCGVFKNLIAQTKISHPHLIILNYDSFGLQIKELNDFLIRHPNTKIIIITDIKDKNFYQSLLDTSVWGYLLHECDKPEIIDCIHSVLFENKRFVCGKILAALTQEPEIQNSRAYAKSISCNGFVFSKRECDIIREIALGFSNKEIADRLNISIHTVATHRKKIMAKIGTNNSAGVVLFAVKNQLITGSYF